MIRVLVVDDHEIMRRGLNMVFELDNRFELVGEAFDGEDAIAKADELAPDVILMDIKMPRVNGIQASMEIKRRQPKTKIMILTAFDDDDEINDAIHSGVDAYILKSISSEELAEAVRMVAAGQTYLHSMTARKAMEKLYKEKSAPKAGCSLAQVLTDRESVVLRLMAEGHKNKAIASMLFLSEETIKSHVSHILAKLNRTDRMQAVLYALRHNLVKLSVEEE